MTTHDESMDGEWTAKERSRLAALPMSRPPSHEMKRRTFDAARAAGYVQHQSGASRARIVALLAAAVVIFSAGITLGYALAKRAVPQSMTTPRTTNHAAVASTQGFTITTVPNGGVVWY
jgi:hypothetical protein